VADQTPRAGAVLANLTAFITPVIRFDSSGTTEIFTNALSIFSSEFNTTLGTKSLFDARFTNGTIVSALRGPGNEGSFSSVSQARSFPSQELLSPLCSLFLSSFCFFYLFAFSLGT
jgi:ABC-type phosphate transport system substrate-binding protein